MEELCNFSHTDTEIPRDSDASTAMPNGTSTLVSTSPVDSILTIAVTTPVINCESPTQSAKERNLTKVTLLVFLTILILPTGTEKLTPISIYLELKLKKPPKMPKSMILLCLSQMVTKRPWVSVG